MYLEILSELFQLPDAIFLAEITVFSRLDVSIIDEHSDDLQIFHLSGQLLYFLFELLVFLVDVLVLGLAQLERDPEHGRRVAVLAAGDVVQFVGGAFYHPHEFRAEDQQYGDRGAQLGADEPQEVLHVGPGVGKQQHAAE